MRLDPALLRFEQVEPGLAYGTGGITVTEAHILGFAGLTGDFFDIHMDDDYARALGYPGRVAHGLLGLALCDGLKNRASVRFAAIVSLGWRWSFTGPDPGRRPHRGAHYRPVEASHAQPGARHPDARLRAAEPARRGRAEGRERPDGAHVKDRRSGLTRSSTGSPRSAAAPAGR
jgi:hypothetical protein